MKTIRPKFIKKPDNQNPSLVFDYLRSQGIDELQKLSGGIWTDFNLHDPGVTILEQLCYAITELGYKTDLPVRDLLRNANGKIDTDGNAFFEKMDILSSYPITINDFRRSILDSIDEVDNVWLRVDEDIEGSYTVLVQINADYFPASENSSLHSMDAVRQIEKKIKAFLSSRRNLCEDFGDIIILEPQNIMVNADVYIEGNDPPENILSQIYMAIEKFFSRNIKSISEDKSSIEDPKAEDMHEGPVSDNVFIPESELSPQHSIIEVIDLLDIITRLKGVKTVKNLTLSSRQGVTGNKSVQLAKNKFPVLDPDMYETNAGSFPLRLIQDNHTYNLSTKEFNNKLKIERELGSEKHKQEVSAKVDEKNKRLNYTNIGQYYSIQHQFPLYYGIGRNGLPDSAPLARKGQALQLKAYLMLFEQILANYASQLANVKNIFSVKPSDYTGVTYFTQALINVPDADFIVNNIAGDEFSKVLNNLIETKSQSQKRRNRLLDHLLARFNESVHMYPAVKFASNYGGTSKESKFTYLIKWKTELLNRYIELGQRRAVAFDYSMPYKATNTKDGRSNMSGFEHKMAIILGIDHNDQKSRLNAFGSEVSLKAGGSNANMNPYSTYITLKSDSGNIVVHDKIPETGDLANGSAESIFSGYNNAGIEYILKHGINPEKYHIALNDLSGKWYLLLEDISNDMIVVSKHSDKEAANIALKSLNQKICDISIRSEGFHLLEHNLLGHSVDSALRDFNITVFMPSWPARFQSKSFREYVQNLFRIHGPAHIRFHFRILSITSMGKFEESYFKWLDLLRMNDPERHMHAQKLVDYINV